MSSFLPYISIIPSIVMGFVRGLAIETPLLVVKMMAAGVLGLEVIRMARAKGYHTWVDTFYDRHFRRQCSSCEEKCSSCSPES